ncbi:MAG: outer membrane lipoprotein carrier protein LolA [Phycisphaerales bacterium]
MRTDAIPTLAACLTLTTALLACAQQQTAAQDVRPVSTAMPQAEFDSAEAVLTALEEADQDLRTFDSGIAYTTINDLGGAITRRTGSIAFASNPAPADTPRRRFAVRFDTLLRGERYLTDERALQTIAFDGRWLWEKIHSEMQVNKREIVRQGESVDPFELGDGPFPPLPIGQQKDDILRRYDVRLVPSDDSLAPDPDLDERFEDEKREKEMAEALVKFAQGSVQLRLVPRGAEPRFAEIRLWYKPDDDGRLLPRMSRTVDAQSRDISIVQLMHPLSINGPAREDLLQVTVDEGWSLSETRLPAP